MAIGTYTARNWKNGDVLTADDLNQMSTQVANITSNINGMDNTVTTKSLTVNGATSIKLANNDTFGVKNSSNNSLFSVSNATVTAASMTVDGALSANSITATGALSANSITVTETITAASSTLSGNLTVSGTGNFSGKLTASDNVELGAENSTSTLHGTTYIDKLILRADNSHTLSALLNKESGASKMYSLKIRIDDQDLSLITQLDSSGSVTSYTSTIFKYNFMGKTLDIEKLSSITLATNTFIIGQQDNQNNYINSTTIYGNTTIENLTTNQLAVSSFTSIPTFTTITSAQKYAVERDQTSGGLFVHVPWTDGGTVPVYSTQTADGEGNTYKFADSKIAGTRNILIENTLTAQSYYQMGISITTIDTNQNEITRQEKLFEYQPAFDSLLIGIHHNILIQADTSNGVLSLTGQTIYLQGTSTFDDSPRIPALVFHDPKHTDTTDDEVLTKADIQAIKTYCGIPLNNGGA